MSRPAPLPLEEAQARLLALATPLPIERVDVDGAIGRFLATPLLARRTQPAADLSAMDGYAVNAADMVGPWRIVGESSAGHPWSGQLDPGQAVRISTGAALPVGAGAVILQEDITRSGEMIALAGEPPSPPGKHIRRQGMDFAANAPVLDAGAPIGPAQAALAIAAGHAHLPVRRRARIAIIDSGDELAGDCENCPSHQIPASNGTMLAAMVATLPCDVQRAAPVPDNLDALVAALDTARDADVIVTSGGASVGDHDLVRPALARWGATVDFWRVAIKPGKPLLVATREHSRGRQLVIGLPGNPVSSHVTAFLFLLPYLRAVMGASHPLPRRVRTRVATPLRQGGSRREFLRVRWDGATASVLPVQDSGALAPLAAANALLDRAAGAPPLAADQEAWIYLLANGGIA